MDRTAKLIDGLQRIAQCPPEDEFDVLAARDGVVYAGRCDPARMRDTDREAMTRNGWRWKPDFLCWAFEVDY